VQTPVIDTYSSKKAGSSKPELAKAIMLRYTRLEEDRNYWMSMWQSISELVMPRKSYILSPTITPSVDRETRLFDSTAVRANMVLAAGCMSYITPADSKWCSFEAPENIEDGEGVQEYFAEVTQVVLQTLARSNFHSAIHELYLDRGCFGTAVMFVEAGETTPIVFRNIDVGTFVLSENHEGVVDTCFRKFEMTARQMVEEFGIENVSDTIRKAHDESKNLDQKFEVLHGVYPRSETERDPKKLDGVNKPFASCYLETRSKHILRESGYDEQPFMATRYLKWQQGVYGWSPSWVALPDIRQLNFLQKQMDALAELAAFPRILVPDGMENDVDLRAGGITYFNASDPSAKPAEWATQGRYDVGLERVREKQTHINEAFSVPLFQMFTQQESMTPNRMTATEVNARNAERLANFSPTFARLTTELLIPLLQRVYGILARRGELPPPPEALIQQDAKGELFVPEPQVVFNSRIALAVRTMELAGAERAITSAAAMAQATQDPSILDNFNFDLVVRDGALANGMDAEQLRPIGEVQQLRAGRQQAAQMQAQQQQQLAMAEMANKAAAVKPDSVIGQRMMQQGPMA
jgi:Bacteriophage head to tail connecting protein